MDEMFMKSRLIGVVSACLCLFSTGVAQATTVYASSFMTDNFGDDWRLYLVTSSTDLSDETLLTGIYLDSLADGSIDSTDLLSNSPFDVAVNSVSPYDLASDGLNGGYSFSQLPPTGDWSLNSLLLERMFQLGTGGDSLFLCLSSCTLVPNYVPIDTPSQDAVADDLILNASTALTFTRVAAVPVPAAVWLFSSGLLGLVGVARRKAA